MKIAFLAICCFAVVLSTYADPQSPTSDPQTGNQSPTKNPSKGSPKNPSKGSPNNPSKGSPNNGKKGQQGTNNKNKKGSRKVGNSQQGPPSGYNGQKYNQDSIDVKNTYNGRAGRGAFAKK